MGWDLDLVLYSVLGMCLLGYTAFDLGRTIWFTGSYLLFGVFVLGLLVGVLSIVRDIVRRQLGWVSRGVLFAWALCSVVIFVDLF